MANKINAKLILELKASGLSRNQIAATRHMSKHSVSDVINIAKEKGMGGLSDLWRCAYPGRVLEMYA